MDVEKMLNSVWAKSRDGANFISLRQHSRDTLGMADHLVTEFLPYQVLRGFLKGSSAPPDTQCPASDLDGTNLASPGPLSDFSDTDIAVLSSLIAVAGIHDVGKSHPDFSHMVPAGAEAMLRAGLPGADVPLWNDGGRPVHHTLTGAAAVLDLSDDDPDRFDPDASMSIAHVVAGHHGVWHDGGEFLDLQDHPVPVPEEYKAVQAALVNDVVDYGDAPAFGQVSMNRPAMMLAAGVTIAADWLASDTDMFPYGDPHPNRLERAIEARALPSRLFVAAPDPDPAVHLRTRFSLPEDAQPRPFQDKMVRIAHEASHGRLYIIEAATGEGKTEASCLAAEVLMSKGLAGGLSIALPTQSTTDGMLPRIIDFVNSIPGLESGADINLGHGRRMHNKVFRKLLDRGRISQHEPCPGTCGENYTHPWFQRKTGGLATFHVSTVDVVAMSALRLRHVALRHLGLAGKVVIIDEVHAYDAFLRRHLCKTLSYLGAYGTSVILMSATLPSEFKAELIEAYNGAFEPPQKWDSAYPLITTIDAPGEGGVEATQHAAGSTVSTKVINTHMVTANRRDEVAQIALDISGGSGCILLIRNTVREAIDTWELLRGVVGDEHTSLHHSRFVAADRAAHDRDLLAKFGSQKYLEDVGGQRPDFHIAVTTQVVEQSLDVDFDALITDLAPADLLLQRAGRMHRHSRADRPSKHSEPWMYVLMAGFANDSAVPYLGWRGGAIYDRWVMTSTAGVLHKYRDKPILVPEDVRDVVESTYDPEYHHVPEGWRGEMAEMRAEYEAADLEHKMKAEALQLPDPYEDVIDVTSAWRSGTNWSGEDDPSVQKTVRDGVVSLEVALVESSGDGYLKPMGMKDHDPLRTDRWLSIEGKDTLAEATIRWPLHSDKLSTKYEEMREWLLSRMPEKWIDDRNRFQTPVLVMHGGSAVVCDINNNPLVVLTYSLQTGLEWDVL